MAVVCCRTHGRHFTIYPPGFVPYGRLRLPTNAEEIADAPALLAVQDRAEPGVERWPDFADPDGVTPGWASTQWRHIGRWGRWLGLAGSEDLGQRVSTTLGIPLHEHSEARVQYSAGGDQRRSQAILAVLTVLGRVGGMWVRLLRAGHLVGLLGRAFRVHVNGGLRRLVPF